MNSAAELRRSSLQAVEDTREGLSMNLWHIVLFSLASLLALRSFVGLTNHHQRTTLQKLMIENSTSNAANVESSGHVTKSAA